MATSPILGDLQSQLSNIDEQILERQKILSGQGGNVPGWNSNHPPSNPKTVAKMQQEIQQLQAQKAQLQASAQLPNLENLAGQGQDISSQLVPLLKQITSSQQGLADMAKQYAQTSLDNKLKYAGDVGNVAESYSSKAPGELTPAAQAQLENDLESISGAYGRARETGLRTLGYAGSSAPQGALASMINTSGRDAANAETQARRQATQTSEAQRLQGAQLESGLASMFDPERAGSAAQSGYGAAANTGLSEMSPVQQTAGLYNNVIQGTNPVANQANNLSNLWQQYGQTYQKTSPLGTILKAVGSGLGMLSGVGGISGLAGLFKTAPSASAGMGNI